MTWVTGTRQQVRSSYFGPKGFGLLFPRIWEYIPLAFPSEAPKQKLPTPILASVCIWYVSACTETPNLLFGFAIEAWRTHPSPPPHRNWPPLILLNLAKFQLVWRRLCKVVLFSSTLLVKQYFNGCFSINRVSFSSPQKDEQPSLEAQPIQPSMIT